MKTKNNQGDKKERKTERERKRKKEKVRKINNKNLRKEEKATYFF